MAATFKGKQGTTYGFTGEDGRQVTRRAGDDGKITARDQFEENHFRSIGLKESDPPKKRKSSRKSAKKAAAKASSTEPTPITAAKSSAETPAETKE